MPGAAKPYKIKVFLFDADQPGADSHWFDWEFDVVGLNNLPRELAARIFPVIGPVAADTEHSWATKRVPRLRKSLSYHGAEHGVTGFPATTLDGKTYKVRVIAYGTPKTGPTAAPAYKLTTELYRNEEFEVALETWEYARCYDLTSGIGQVQHIVGNHLLSFPNWNVRRIVARLQSAMGHGKDVTQQAFTAGSDTYIAVFKVEKLNA